MVPLIGSLYRDGVNVMIYGMGTVFSFLILLVFSIQLMTMVTGIVSNPKQASEYKSIVNTAKIDSNGMYLTPIRMTESFINPMDR